jgi:alpha-ketoglutarate-dependent taurine dioxygenase
MTSVRWQERPRRSSFQMMTLKIEPLTPEIGANIHIAADAVLDPGVPEQIMDALNRYDVLVFPEVHLSDDSFAALTDRLGEQHDLAITFDQSEASNKGIYRIALDKDDQTQLDIIRGNDIWHMDGTVYDTPGKSTMLKCESPAREGGDTEFASLTAGYAALPEDRKAQIDGLRVIHCLAAVGVQLYDDPTEADFARWDAVFPLREHPLVWHQRDGRTSLLIGGTAQGIIGMDPAKGRTLIDGLIEWCTGPRFTYRHTWRKGDMVMFNNPAMLHRSLPYTQGSGRLMHRTTVKGYEAIA